MFLVHIRSRNLKLNLILLSVIILNLYSISYFRMSKHYSRHCSKWMSPTPIPGNIYLVSPDVTYVSVLLTITGDSDTTLRFSTLETHDLYSMYVNSIQELLAYINIMNLNKIFLYIQWLTFLQFSIRYRLYENIIATAINLNSVSQLQSVSRSCQMFKLTSA